MKKVTLLILLCILFFHGEAQNWLGVIPNDTTYYTYFDPPLVPLKTQSLEWAFNKLRVIWIDSSKIQGSDTIYYFYPSIRVKPIINCLDSNGATWLGKYFIRRSNGDEIYFNRNLDSILIKTEAILNQSWIMMQDSNNTIYTATIISLDTMTIDGELDSIKKVGIQAFNNGQFYYSDYNQIILSKHHGFQCVYELFVFPYQYYQYHAVDTLNTILYSTRYNPMTYIPHTRLDDEYVTRNLSVDTSKYRPGNYWYMKIDTTFFAGNYFVSSNLLFDSIISLNTIGLDLYEVVYLQRVYGAATVSQIITDTIYLPATYYSIKGNMLPEYKYDSTDYTISLYCDNSIAVSARPKLFEFTNVTPDCLGLNFFVSGFSNYFETTYFEGFGEASRFNYFVDQNFGQIHDYSTYMILFQINGCYGSFPSNKILSANEFKASAQLQNNFDVNVNWFTTNEKNVNHFEVQRSVDKSNFETIKEQASLGENINKNFYEVKDNIQDIQDAEVIYYRIKMIDIDGRYSYSNVTYVNPKSYHQINVYPTLFKNELTISYPALTNTILSIRLIDLFGKTMYSNKINTSTQTNKTTYSNFETLAIGIYFVEIINEENGERKLFKVNKY